MAAPLEREKFDYIVAQRIAFLPYDRGLRISHLKTVCLLRYPLAPIIKRDECLRFSKAPAFDWLSDCIE